MTQTEYDAWCWDNRVLFSKGKWEAGKDYFARLGTFSAQGGSDQSDDFFRNVLVQTNPVSADCSHIKKTLTFNINFRGGIFTDFSFNLFHGIADSTVEFYIGDGNAQNCYILEKMGDDNNFSLSFFKYAREISELLHILSYNAAFNVLIRGEGWKIKSEIYGSLRNPAGISKSLEKMLLVAKHSFLESFQFAKGHWTAVSQIKSMSDDVDKLILEIENFILNETGIKRNTNGRGEIFYSYSSIDISKYGNTIKAELANEDSVDILCETLEHQVVSFASIFASELVFLSNERLHFFLGNDIDFHKVANTMNDIVGIVKKRQGSNAWDLNAD